MITICAILVAHPGKEKTLEDILMALVEPISKEPGTLEYKIHRAIDNPGRFYFHEKYTNQAAIDVHMATPHFKDLLVKLEGVIAQAPDIVLYEEVASVR